MKILRATAFSILYLLGFTHIALPQSDTPSGVPVPLPENRATIERPDFGVQVPRPNAPGRNEYLINGDSEEREGAVYRVRGHALIELHNATFKADFVEYNEDTSVFTAHGNVYYRNYEHSEVIYCDALEYNSDTERGTFHHVRGYARTKIVARPGVLTTQQPFYFEGKSADKFEDRYVLYDGFITDCTIPNPWWTLHGSSFDIIPDERAIARRAVYRVRRVPAFYFPYFYKSLEKRPRKSGFLTPNFGTSSSRGYVIATGYYWAISRSMDVTYIIQDFTSRGFAHHVDFRGKPTQRSDFNLIFYGVQDRGSKQGNGAILKTPGYSIRSSGRTEFANGWVARGTIDYLSSLAFRQQFSESFNEAIFSETHSAGSVEKNFGYQSFAVLGSRSENFQDITPGNSIVIRALPELNLSGRDRKVLDGRLPVWFSFNSSYGLHYRLQPRPNGDLTRDGFYQTSQFSSRLDLEPTVNTAVHWGELHLLPSFTMHETSYGQSYVNRAVTSRNLLRSAPEFNLDLVFPSISRVFDRKTRLGDKLKHVIEPRVQYKYVTGVNRFGEALRFDTLDLLSNTNELEIGITNRLYSKTGDSVNEILTWELTQKRFFDPTFGGAIVPGQRNVVLTAIELTGFSFLDGRRTYSPIVSNLRASPRPGIGFTWATSYDPALSRFVNSAFGADYRFQKFSVSASSDQVRPSPAIAPPANQFRSTVGYGDPNRKGINAAFTSVYDYRQGRLQYAIAQTTYNTDCCGISIQIRHLSFGNRDENAVFASFSIANIGSVGNLKKQERLF